MRLDFDFGEGGSLPLWYITSRYAPNQPMTYFSGLIFDTCTSLVLCWLALTTL